MKRDFADFIRNGPREEGFDRALGMSVTDQAAKATLYRGEEVVTSTVRLPSYAMLAVIVFSDNAVTPEDKALDDRLYASHSASHSGRSRIEGEAMIQGIYMLRELGIFHDSSNDRKTKRLVPNPLDGLLLEYTDFRENAVVEKVLSDEARRDPKFDYKDE